MALEEDQAFLEKIAECSRELGFWYQKKYEQVSYKGLLILETTAEQKGACDSVIDTIQQKLLALVQGKIQQATPGPLQSQTDVLNQGTVLEEDK
jgi:hypothetical protein